MNVVITGANRGIGLALAKKFHAEGANVIGLCRQASPELKESDIEYWEGFNLMKDETYTVLEKVLKQRKIDLLINNAGILMSQTIESTSPMDYNNIRMQLEINSIAPLRMSQAALPHLRENGKIAIITSRMGSVEDNTSGGQYGYRMSKAAVNIAGKSLSVDLKEKGHPVALIHPGYVQTDMTAQNGNIAPEEAAEGIYNVISKLNIENTGTFWHSNGEVLPW